MIPFLKKPTRYIFFTGKGGVGKTSLACATAVALADSGKSVLIVSTDPASNLEQVLENAVTDEISPVESVEGLSCVNIDPEEAAEIYRNRTVSSLAGGLPDEMITQLREQLSGACTTEIASFDQFTRMLVDESIKQQFDHIIFDTAPTGHTLRLLELPAAWSSFIEDNPEGASCLGPLSGLESQQKQYNQAVEALSNPGQTTLVMVTRAERSALNEAARSGRELKDQGIKNQLLVVNGVFRATDRSDSLAVSIEKQEKDILKNIPESLKDIPTSEVPLKGYNLVGVESLRKLLSRKAERTKQKKENKKAPVKIDIPRMQVLIDEISKNDAGLIMVMGKGGVGKTTVAASIAVALAEKGMNVHLSTTDPAGNITQAVEESTDTLKISRIDPKKETREYIDNVMKTKGKALDEDKKKLLMEDLRSPCTEEVAVFHAFSRIVREAAQGIVVLDTAPTGHTLLLLDRTGSYHTEILRKINKNLRNVTTPLMRLQDPQYTKLLIVTLPETTPVLEAADLQDDLERAGIKPFAWIVNRSLAAAGPKDPLLVERAEAEHVQIRKVQSDLAERTYIVPWLPEEPAGYKALLKLIGS